MSKETTETKATKKTVTQKAKELKEASKKQATGIRESVAAHKIEDKKAVRSAKRTMQQKAEAAKNQAEDIREAVVAHKINDKKTVAKAKRTVKETAGKVKRSVQTPAKKKALAKLEIVIQSPMGGSITDTEISAKLPKGAVSVFVRVDENKLYYVLKDGATGSVAIWE
jgi:ribonuclease PH